MKQIERPPRDPSIDTDVYIYIYRERERGTKLRHWVRNVFGLGAPLLGCCPAFGVHYICIVSGLHRHMYRDTHSCVLVIHCERIWMLLIWLAITCSHRDRQCCAMQHCCAE